MTFKRVALLLAGCAAAIAILGGLTDADLLLAHAMAGAGGAPFPLRHNWFAETLSHDWLKLLLLAAAACAVVPALADCWRPRARWPAGFRMRLRVLALAALLVPLAVSLLKRASSSHCPWDLAEFGGAEIYVRLFEPALPGAVAGHCMPAGHASAGLWLVALAVFWLPERPRMAAAVIAATLGFGFGMGMIQQLRGAHFLSHTLWSMWIACAIVAALWRIMNRKNSSATSLPGRTARRADRPAAGRRRLR